MHVSAKLWRFVFAFAISVRLRLDLSDGVASSRPNKPIVAAQCLLQHRQRRLSKGGDRLHVSHTFLTVWLLEILDQSWQRYGGHVTNLGNFGGGGKSHRLIFILKQLD